MPENVYTYLKFVRFKDIERWDMKSLLDNSLHFKYQECKFKKILSKTVIEWVDIEDELEYPILGVHAQGEGVYINNVSKGKSLTMKRYQKSKEMSLFYCKVRTVKGQWGIVYPEYSNSYGSSNMQYLDVAYDMIMPQYLMNLLKLNRLTSHWDKNAIGADGRHFNFDTLMNLTFPLPSLAEQDALVSAYNDKISHSEALEMQAAQVEQDIEDYLLSELGIKQKGYTQAEPAATIASEPQVEYVVSNRQLEDRTDTYHWGDEIKKEYKYLKFVRFKDVERWDCYNEESSFLKKLKVSPFPIVEIGNVYDFIQRRWDKKGSKFNYVEIGSVDPLKGILYAEEIPTDKAPSRATQKINKGDLIIGTTRPYLKKFAIVNEDYDGCICSSGFQVVAPQNKYNLSYLCEVLKISVVISQFESFMSGALYPAITNKDLKKIQIPLPPIDIQNSIVEHINKQKEQIKQLRLQAENLRKEALEDFEKEIFE